MVGASFCAIYREAGVRYSNSRTARNWGGVRFSGGFYGVLFRCQPALWPAQRSLIVAAVLPLNARAIIKHFDKVYGPMRKKQRLRTSAVKILRRKVTRFVGQGVKKGVTRAEKNVQEILKSKSRLQAVWVRLVTVLLHDPEPILAERLVD